MNLILAGLTGAGKTTHCQLLNDEYKLTLISGSEVRSMFKKCSSNNEKRSYWLFSESAINLDKKRLSEPNGEKEIDKYIQELALNETNQVFDVWFLPWYDKSNSLKIWIDVPLKIRAKRLYEILKAEKDYNQLIKMIEQKDIRSQQYAQKMFGIDIFSDRQPFDIIISIKKEVSIDIIKTLLSIVYEKRFNVDNRRIRITKKIQNEFLKLVTQCPPDLYP